MEKMSMFFQPDVLPVAIGRFAIVNVFSRACELIKFPKSEEYTCNKCGSILQQVKPYGCTLDNDARDSQWPTTSVSFRLYISGDLAF